MNLSFTKNILNHIYQEIDPENSQRTQDQEISYSEMSKSRMFDLERSD